MLRVEVFFFFLGGGLGFWGFRVLGFFWRFLGGLGFLVVFGFFGALGVFGV